ncbi:MAG: hypothetical protein ACRDHM_07380 [Actinomycetota bacterium]
MGIPTWLPDRIPSVDGGTFPVQRHDSGVRGEVSDSGTHRGVLHTTESSVIPAFTRGTPHIALGPPAAGEAPVLRQLIPFGHMGTALQNDPGGVETNRRVLIQIEQVGYSAREVWFPRKEQAAITASLLEWCEKELGIPQVYPYNPEDVRTGIWAVEGNPWRRSGRFNREAGWHGHIAVPENDHWDPGGEDVKALLGVRPASTLVEAFQLVAAWERPDGHRRAEGVSPHFATKRALYKWFVQDGTDLPRKAVREHWSKGHRLYIAEREVEAGKVRD